MKKATSHNSKAKLYNIDLDLSDDEMNIIQKKFTFALENL